MSKALNQLYNASLNAAVGASIVRPSNKANVAAALVQDDFERRIQEETRPNAFEKLGGAMSKNTDARIYNGLVEKIWGDEFEPVPDYKADLKALPVNADRDLISDYANAKSPQEAEKHLRKFEEEQQRMQAVGAGGGWGALGYSLLAEGASVSNWVAPFAAARVLKQFGTGSLVAAQAGNRTGYIAGNITESVLSGTALEAAAQYSDGKFNGTDLMVSLAADTLIGGAMSVIGYNSVLRAESLVGKAAESAAERSASLAVRAEAKLGPNASSGELRKVMEQLEKEDVNVMLKDSLAPAPTPLIRDEPTQTDAPRLPGDGQPLDVEDVPLPTSRFATAEQLAQREVDMAPGGKYADEWELNSGGMIKTADEFKALGKGVHVLGDVPAESKLGVDTVQRLAKAFLPEHTLTINFSRIPMSEGRFANGAVTQTGRTGAMIRIDPTLAPSQIVRSVAHEVGHVVFNSSLSKAKIKDIRGVTNAWKEFAAEALGTAVDGNKARGMRFSALNVDQGATREFTPKLRSEYELDFDEYLAEQFTKYLEKDAAGANKFGLSNKVIAAVKEALQRVMALFKKVNREVPDVDPRVGEFLDNVLKQVDEAVQATPIATRPSTASQATVPADVVNELMTDPALSRFGMQGVPVGTATERKHAQAMLALHKQAAEWAAKNPMDAKWMANVQNLADNNVFNVASNGLVMLKSQNPLVRMLASELLEDAGGVAGKRQATAAISKHLTERFMLGNAINDVQGAYEFWKKGKPGGLKDDLVGGTNWAAFNKEIAAEIEARRLAKAPVSTDPNVKAAADSLEAAYQRTADAQRKVGTLGAEGLPETSVGYMPHRMSPAAVFNLNNEQRQIVHDALMDQFITIEGWDASFSDQLASSYMKRVRDRASGDYGSNIGGGNPGAATLVEEALQGMNLPDDVIAKHMDKFTKGSANFTKGRIELDLNKVYKTADGEFRLMDIFDTDQMALLRSQAGRASGEVALTRFGVRGKPGLKLLRDAMHFGEDKGSTTLREFEAFDQMAAEFMNEPFGTKAGKFMENAMAANTLVRLGGIAFNQLAESFNAVFHVGVANTLSSIKDIPRLRSEIVKLSKGQKVDNSIIGSIELAGGAEFGTDAYKIVMPFDSPDHLYPTYGQDTVTLTDRLLRGGGYLQSKLSMWRMIHSSQQRGMAEQIVHKMMRFIREGKDDVALQQFGITPEIQAALRGDLANIAKFDSAGNLMEFDVTKIADPDIREQVIQAVWRGTSQIIQGTFIGERGKWAHDGWMRMLTQFRTFSITSMEKQWGRQRNSRGSAAAFGMLIGAMSMAAPIYMARVYANSIGRPDQQEFLDERLSAQNVARATLNYVAMSGMAGDFIDLISSTLPDELGVKPTGGRSGVESDFVGNYVLPASSLVNDVWKYAQSPLEMDDAARILPGSRLPFLVPLFNTTKE